VHIQSPKAESFSYPWGFRMRITNNLSTQLAIRDFAKARDGIDNVQRQLTSGLRFEASSEDPVAAAGVMRNSGQLRAIEQYRSNVGLATSRASLEESTLAQLDDLLTRAKELAVAQGTITASADTRAAAGAEVNQLIAQAVQLANTKSGGEYLYGGTTSTTVPYTIDTSGSAYSFTVAATAPTGTREIEIGPGQTVRASHDGTTVFGTASAGVLKSLSDLSRALQAGTLPGVVAAIDPIDSALTTTRNVLAESGARATQLAITDANLMALSNQLTTFNAALQDVDLPAAISELTGRQTSYQAAMVATARVSNLSLADYLR
jgi:flagellar hook-associated protein 3 FlgL